MAKTNNKIWKKRDYIIFFILIPVVLILFYIIPQSIKNIFILDMKHITILNIFFSNYIHSNLLNHLIPNLIIYLLLMLIIFKLETDKKLFYKVMISLFILLPFLVSLYLIKFLPLSTQGFSAITSGIMGYFLYVFYRYVRKNYDKKINSDFLLLLIVINAFLVLITHRIWSWSSLMFAIALIYVYKARLNLKKIFWILFLDFKNICKSKYSIKLYKISIFVLSIYFLFSLSTILPVDIRIENNNVINIASHYFGYVFGICIPLIIVGLEKLKKELEEIQKLREEMKMEREGKDL